MIYHELFNDVRMDTEYKRDNQNTIFESLLFFYIQIHIIYSFDFFCRNNDFVYLIITWFIIFVLVKYLKIYDFTK